jgi:dTDP-4-dehydrorhamnose 3,5-epimerase
MIEGVTQTALKQIQDERGKIMHMLRATDSHFQQFGEIYFSWIYPGTVKAWHKHLEMTLNYVVPVGCVKVVLYDDRSASKTYKQMAEYFMSAENYYLLTIPSGIWYGLKTVGAQPAMIANCSTIPHNPKEIVRISSSDSSIPYNWELKYV